MKRFIKPMIVMTLYFVFTFVCIIFDLSFTVWFLGFAILFLLIYISQLYKKRGVIS